MRKSFMVGTLMLVAVGCSKSHDVSLKSLTVAGPGDGTTGVAGAASAAGGGAAAPGGGVDTTDVPMGAMGLAVGGAGMAGNLGGPIAQPSVPQPQEGGQLASCTDDQDCDNGLSCYSSGGYCSRECDDDAVCASLGGSYTCSGSGSCRLECQGENDNSCPQGMSCEQGNGGGGGGGGTFRCEYPEPENEQQQDQGEQQQDQEEGGGGQQGS